MSAAENPLRTLYIDRELARRLSDADLERLVDHQYRFLQKLFHPDVGGDPETARRLNAARAALDRGADPEGFARLRAAYGRREPGSAKLAVLSLHSRALARRHAELIAGLTEFAQAALDPAAGPSVFTPGPLRLPVIDPLAARRTPTGATSAQSARAFGTLTIGRDHTVTLRFPGRPVQHTDRSLAFALRGKTLTGSAPDSVNGLLDLLAPARPSDLPGLTSRRIARDAAQAALTHVTPQMLEPLVGMLTPWLARDNYLFSSARDESGLHFILEGRIAGPNPKSRRA